MRSFGQERPDIKKGYTLQKNQLGQYVQSQPLLKTAQGGVLDFWGNMFGPNSALATGYANNIAPIIASGGALTPAGERDVAQATRASFADRGNVTGNQALGAELLNRESAQQNRLNTALGQAGQIQGIETGGLNQLLGVQSGEVGTFSQLNNPILAYLGNLFGGNQQASIAQAQINQQANQANQAKTSDTIGQAISSVGTIAGAAAMSDERIKTKIRDTGVKTKDKIPFKVFEYATRPGVKFLGHTAQDVEKKRPDAVITDPVSGLKMVDFIKLGSRMVQLDPYGKAAA